MDRTTKRLGIALAISVGLNLFCVGAVTAHLLRPPRPMPGPDTGQFFFRATEGLSAPGRAKVRSIMKRHRQGLLPRRQAMRQARQDVQAALGAEPFDRHRLEQSLARLLDDTSQAQRELHSALVEAAEQLGPADRKQLAQAMARFRGRGGPPPRRH